MGNEDATKTGYVESFPMFVENERHFTNFVNSMIEFEDRLVKD